MTDQLLDLMEKDQSPRDRPILMEIMRQYHQLTTPMKRRNQTAIGMKKLHFPMRQPPIDSSDKRFMFAENLYKSLRKYPLREDIDEFDPEERQMRVHQVPHSQRHLGDTFYNVPIHVLQEGLSALDETDKQNSNDLPYYLDHYIKPAGKNHQLLRL